MGENDDITPPRRRDGGGPPLDANDIRPVVEAVTQRTTRFSREFVATMIALASAAFGVVAALAWNAAITAVFTHFLGADTAGRIGALFGYAIVVTLIGVTVIVFLGRLATRINAQPIEFKYPGTPKT